MLDGKAFPAGQGEHLAAHGSRTPTATGLSSDRVVFDDSSTVLTDQTEVLGYYSWGSNDPAITPTAI